MYKFTIIFFNLSLIFSLVGCSRIQGEETTQIPTTLPDAHAQVTTVALPNKVSPTATATPTLTPTATPTYTSPATPTPVPTNTPTPTSTPIPLPLTPVTTSYRLSIPDIGVDAPIVGVGLHKDGRSMAYSHGSEAVGWFVRSAKPGEIDNVVLGGHRDWTDRQTGIPSTAVFWRLGDLKPSSKVYVCDSITQWEYVVTKSLLYEFDDPTAAPCHSSKPILTMITCEGTFDPATRNYSQRRIIIAELRETTFKTSL